MKLSKYLSLVLMLMLFTISCAEKEAQDNDMDEGETSATNFTKAVAVVHPTEGNKAMGTVTFEQTSQGVKVHTEMNGLSSGMHGYHIHLYGDCTAPDGTSAGTHFNFEGSSLNPPADIDRITGNLGNLNANDSGEAIADTLIPNATLNGAKSIIGRSVVVHAKANDPSQPPIGAAGSRLGCGVIGIANTGTE